MERLINIGGKEVNFKATAATPVYYRNCFSRDMMRDMEKLADEMDANKNSKYSIASLEVFEKVAYIMAKSGAEDKKSFPKNPIEWLDQFEMFSIYEILPELIELWGVNTKTLNTSKKK